MSHLLPPKGCVGIKPLSLGFWSYRPTKTTFIMYCSVKQVLRTKTIFSTNSQGLMVLKTYLKNKNAFGNFQSKPNSEMVLQTYCWGYNSTRNLRIMVVKLNSEAGKQEWIGTEMVPSLV